MQFVIEPDSNFDGDALRYTYSCQDPKHDPRVETEFYKTDVTNKLKLIEVKIPAKAKSPKLTWHYQNVFKRISQFENVERIIINNYEPRESFFNSEYFGFVLEQIILLKDYQVEIIDFLIPEYIYTDKETHKMLQYLNMTTKIQKSISRIVRG